MEEHSELFANDDNFLCLQRTFLLPLRGLFVFFFLSVLYLRNFTPVDKSDTEEKVGDQAIKGSCSHAISSTLCDFFLIFVKLKFAACSTQQENISARVVKASMNVEDLVHLSKFHSNVSSHLP